MRFAKVAVLILGVAGLLTSCGDNSNTCGPGTAADEDGVCLPTGEGPDAARAPDADETAADAEPAPDADTSATVAGTIAITDTTVIDPAALIVGGVRGGAIRISFGDLTMGGHHGGAIAYTDGPGAPISGCLVQRFDAAHQPNPRLDAGTITISAPATGASALLKTVGPCSLLPLLGDPDPYVCVSSSALVATVSGQDLNALSPGSGLVAYTLSPPTLNLGMTAPTAISAAGRASNAVQITTTAAHGFITGQFVTVTGMTPSTFNTAGSPIQVTGANTFVYAQAGTSEAATAFGTAAVPTNVIVGSHLIVNGLAAAFNSGTAAAFPIVGQLSANTVIVINAAPADNAPQAAVTTATYSILNGFSPVPAAGVLANFLGADGKVRIQKPDTAEWPAIDVEVDVPGEAPPPVAITSLARAGNVATATVASGHGVSAGQRITVAGTASPAISLTAAARVANVVTMTTAAAHGLSTGASVTIAGVTPAGATSFSGTFTVTSAPTTTSFTYAQTAGDDAGTGGTATTSFNGTFTVTATTATTFTYASSAQDVAATTPGTYQKSSFALDTPATSPSDFLQMFPRVTAVNLGYGCDNNTAGDTTDDTCGDDSSAPLKAFIISGSATRRSVAGLFPFQMPVESSGSETPWLEWQCAFLASKSAAMPQAAVQAILDFAPTRVEMQALLVGGAILDGDGGNTGTSGLKLLVGHALAGHATFSRATGVDALGTNVTHQCNDGIDNLDSSVGITSVTRATNVVTVTTASAHRLAVGDTGIVIAGVADASFNATVTVISVPSATTFTYDQTAADASSTGGTSSSRDGLIDFGFDPGCGAIPDGPGTDTSEN